ncbi:hypothetical protein GD627_14855 [Arthrobacter yangruifuii]|uniref:Uncharacterized protein n=1 Tax=Arthrobacter yangruifuii TaxID=2606616 RepID=A0A5N6MEM8_9MICC|nr:hypothetical protein [Arthrobacter yangruifuii]KAD3455989.1 hypothetical protein GD627_14855 [Arthrobacter yangruifuii]
MSRLTLGNVFKVTVALLFFPFMPLLILMIGVRRKNFKVILEGALYVALFLAAVSITSTLSAFVGLGVIAVSGMRSYMLRDLWLHRRAPRGAQPYVMAQPSVPAQSAPSSSAPEAPVDPSAQELAQALAWSASLAKQNKARIPTEAYVSILETCQTLDAVIDAEARQPLGDPQFEYELSATVRDYLPSVLRSYLAVPPRMLETRQASGRTPNQELVEQLQLLSGQADTLHASRHRRTSAELTNTGNFLRERFGRGQGYDFGIK